MQTPEQTQEPSVAANADSLAKVSLPRVMWDRAERLAEREFLHVREDSGWRAIKWAQLAGDVRDVARALIALGIDPGDRVAILSNTRYEWTVCDYALLSLGAITVPVYQTSSAEEIEYILNDSGARLVFFEDEEQRQKLQKAKDRLGKVELYVQLEGEPDGDQAWQSLSQFRRRASEVDGDEVKRRAAAVQPDDVATYIYTSGTTGPPKGCVITHWNFVSCGQAVYQQLPGLFGDNDSTLFFLPLAHGFARMVQFVSVATGLQVYYGHIRELAQELQSARPTFFISVPRMFEKAYTGVQSKASESTLGRLVFKLAASLAEPISKARQDGRRIPLRLRLPYLLTDALIFSKVRQALGGNIRYAVSGGAPLAVNVAHFFNAAGITILEGYGLTETAPASTVNAPGRYKIGTVGRTLSCNDVKIADDGEVLMRGHNIFKGYYGDEAKTREVLQDGWFYSGDLGRLDGDGFLTITGRKKDVIITAGGKNITPTLVEDKLKECQYISQAVLIGDQRPYCVALITLDADEVTDQDRGEVERTIARHVEESNRHFGRVEQVKQYTILGHDFSIEAGEITPTLKVKRARIQELYADEIDQLYGSRQ